MIFKKNKHTSHSNQDILSNPHRPGRNTVKPLQIKNSSSAINGGLNRRIDDFNRPSGYHSSLPNLNTQIKAEKSHQNDKQGFFTNINESTDLSTLLNKTNSKKHSEVHEKKKSKFRILSNIIKLIVITASILFIYMAVTGKINILKLILN
jgi:hypothetical protein